MHFIKKAVLVSTIYELIGQASPLSGEVIPIPGNFPGPNPQSILVCIGNILHRQLRNLKDALPEARVL